MVAFKSLFVIAAAAVAVLASPLLETGNTSLAAREPSPADNYPELIARELVLEGEFVAARAEAEAPKGYPLPPRPPPPPPPPPDHGYKSLSETIVALRVEVKAIVKQIKHAVKKGHTDVKTVIELVLKLDATFKSYINKIDKIKGSRGKGYDKVDVSVIIEIFIASSIIITLNTAVKASGRYQRRLLLQVVIQLNVTISIWLKLIFSLVKGLQAKFSAQITANIGAILKNLKFADILAVIKVRN